MHKTTPPLGGRYGEMVFSPATVTESQRLAALADACDPATIRVLADLPVPSGSACLELGAGTGSIAAWMADNLAPRRVVATDRDIHILGRLHHPSVEVRRHDVRVDSFPPASFDLIVARNLLCHLPDREGILDRAIGWLAPGGWIVIEDTSFFPADSSPDPALRALAEAAAATMAATIGTDVRKWARSYPEPLTRRSLTNVGWRVECPQLTPTSPAGRAWRLSVEALAPVMNQTGTLDTTQCTAAINHCSDPTFTDIAYAMIAAWGNRSSECRTDLARGR